MSSSRRSIVEVRVPTYRRPELLCSALASLVGQTLGQWRAFVLDDSPSQEGCAVVKKLSDPRIHYCPNHANLGLVGNLSHALRPEPFDPASRYACVLEDDNRYTPDFLAESVGQLDRTGADILSRRVKQILVASDGSEKEDGIYPPEWLPMDAVPSFKQRALLALVAFGLPNAGYVWRLDSRNNLSVPDERWSEHAQERSRSLLEGRRYIYDHRPMAEVSFRQGGTAGKASTGSNRMRLRWASELAFFRRTLRLFRSAGGSDGELLAAASRLGVEEDIHLRLECCGRVKSMLSLRRRESLLAVAKSPLLAFYARSVARAEESGKVYPSPPASP
jgi:glycosyltransferase involved in cell wall biosynthesis